LLTDCSSITTMAEKEAVTIRSSQPQITITDVAAVSNEAVKKPSGLIKKLTGSFNYANCMDPLRFLLFFLKTSKTSTLLHELL
jgi:hypothetical protein